ncbi:MAG: hypothetical protein IT175_11000 [Acidobacteria bacterium]|nr:hypothetical protein [Acidobacteriota bacterium]
MTQRKKLYLSIGRDPSQWVAQSRYLKIAADALLPQLRDAFSKPPTLPGNRERQLALYQAYMLQAGLAVENAVKAVVIASTPSLVTATGCSKVIPEGHGHGFAAAIQRYIAVSEDERSFLTRLEECVLWSSRYPIPLKFTIYERAEDEQRRSITTRDPELLQAMLTRLWHLVTDRM